MADFPDSAAPPPGLRFEIVVQDSSWPVAVMKTPFCQRIAAAIAKFVEVDRDSLAVIAYSDDAAVRSLNRQYRGRDKATNVLSFEALDPIAGDQTARNAELDLIGDIVLARETVTREAENSTEDSAEAIEHHTAHLIVHGMLHLLGYDHIDGQDAAEMEALEIGILAELGIANPYTEELDDVD